jgi:hypothetical protein
MEMVTVLLDEIHRLRSSGSVLALLKCVTAYNYEYKRIFDNLSPLLQRQVLITLANERDKLENKDELTSLLSLNTSTDSWCLGILEMVDDNCNNGLQLRSDFKEVKDVQGKLESSMDDTSKRKTLSDYDKQHISENVVGDRNVETTNLNLINPETEINADTSGLPRDIEDKLTIFLNKIREADANGS